MRVTKDQWTPLLKSIAEKVSSQGRRKLLFQAIGELQDMTILNFGPNGQNRPSPWPKLSSRYAAEKKGGDTTPTLIQKGRLISGFVHTISDTKATLTNNTEYADEHQFGVRYRNLPARPFYPVTPDGLGLTDTAQQRLQEVLKAHFSSAT